MDKSFTEEQSAETDSFSEARLEYAQYTRPFEFEGIKVPGVLLSGNHEKVRQWRKISSVKRTFIKRPDLFDKRNPDREERKILKQWCRQLEQLVEK